MCDRERGNMNYIKNPKWSWEKKQLNYVSKWVYAGLRIKDK